MCGIVGLVTDASINFEAVIEGMNETIRHRGPDDSGIAVMPDEGVAIGMRRLSIIDLAGGKQPIWDERKDHGIVFNGEIYNYKALRDELVALKHIFLTQSDTEVVVHGFEEWGTDVFRRLHGMFAIAIWDRPNQRLVVARDRAGEKPLYIADIPGGYAIASELKAILTLAGVNREIDPTALEQYLSFDFVLGSRTMIKGVRKLPAGHFAFIKTSGIEEHSYWSMCLDERPMSEGEAVARFDQVLDKAVSSMMVADVPVGLFLSGGLDSSTVGYFMRRHSGDVHSFSIGFEDPRYDEQEYANQVAQHLGTKHHLEVFSEDRIHALVPRAAEILDEPMGDQSIFPTFLLSDFTRKHVKVALGGDGSDELLMGYKTYQALRIAWEADRLPAPVRQAVAATARRLPDRVGPVPLFGKRFAERLDVPNVHRLMSYLGSYHGNGRWVLSRATMAGLPASQFDAVDGSFPNGHSGLTPANQAIGAYARGYLQEDILVKVDRASMAASLEVRAPFLDADVMDFLGTVPSSLKLKGFTRKYLLRQLMRGRLPDSIIDRGKRGFGVPLNSWLRQSLAPMVRQYLDPARLANEGTFDPAQVNGIVQDHLSGAHDRGQELWLLLQFQLWRERWRI